MSVKKKLWYRQDRDGGKAEIVDSDYVALRLKGYYRNVSAVMKTATREYPLTTDFALYWPRA